MNFYQERLKNKKEKTNSVAHSFSRDIIKALRQPNILKKFGEYLEEFTHSPATETKREKLIQMLILLSDIYDSLLNRPPGKTSPFER